MVTPFIMISAIIKVLIDTVKRRYPNLGAEAVQGVAAVVGIAIAALTGMDVASEVIATAGDWPEWLSTAVSGIALGLGANFVHDLVKAVGTAKV